MANASRAAHMARGRRPGLLWLAVGSFLGAGLVMVLGFGEDLFHLREHSLGFGFEAASAALGACLASVIFWWARRRGRLDLFEFPVWFSLNAYVQIVLNVWLLQRDIILRSPWVGGNASVLAPRAALLIGASLAALWIGYVVGHQWLQRRPRWTRPVAESPRLRVVGAVWLATWLVGIGSVLTGMQGYLAEAAGFGGGYYLYVAELVNALASFILMLYHFRRPSRLGWVWLILAVGSNVALGLIIGTKGSVLILLYAMMAAYYAIGKLPKKWLVAGVVVLVATVPVVNTFRSNLFDAGFSRSYGTSFAERVPVLAESVQQVLSRPFSSLTAETRNTLEQRQRSVFDFTTAALAIHPSIRPYLGMDMVSLLAQQFIPRLLWPGKPAVRPELYNLSTMYLGMPEETSFTAPGQFGDVYRTGGWPLVLFWFLSIGALSAWLYQQGPARGNLAGIAFYLVMLNCVLYYEEGLLSIARGVLQIGILLWILAMYVLFQPLPKNSHSLIPIEDDESLHEPI